MHLYARLPLALLCLVLTGCANCNEPNNPVSPEYPCGTRGHQCSSMGCCWNHEDCGGDILGCPEGMCCYRGSGASPEDGSTGRASQWKAMQ